MDGKWELIITLRDGQTEVFPLAKEYIYVGRALDNDIVLKDKGVSRRHVFFRQIGDTLTVTDMGSKNGTTVNDRFIQEKRIAHGDAIRVGSTMITVEQVNVETGAVLIQGEEPITREAGTIIHPIAKLVDASAESPKEDIFAARQFDESVMKLVERQNSVISTLTKISELVNKTLALDVLLYDILEVLFDILPADRGFIIIRDEKTNKLRPVATKYKLEKDTSQTIKISRTILDKVFDDKVSIITSNASIDPRFNLGESIQMYGIRSVLCVPLWIEDAIIGAIYLDSRISDNIFTEPDMKLLTTIANHVALATHRVNLMRKVIEERQIRNNLQRYFSPDEVDSIINNIGKERSTLDLQEIILSVLFCDIKDFTPLAEELQPHQVAILLNKYLNSITQSVFSYKGTIDKFLGDGVMALFGAPYSDEYDTLRAVASAQEILTRINQLNDSLPDIQRFSVRIGINTGKAVAGNLGSDIRMEYTALGDTVNVAQRLEGVSKANCVTIGEQTYNQVKDYFEATYLGELSLKGKKIKVKAFQLTGNLLKPLPESIFKQEYLGDADEK